MNSRRWTPVRVVLGALIGAFFCAMLVFIVAGAVSRAIGNDGGWVIGFVMGTFGAPIALIVGAILGAWSSGSGPSPLVFRPALLAVVLVALAMGLRAALPDNGPKPQVDAQHCTINPRVGTFGPGTADRYVVVYDRYCGGEDGHTVNVSVTTIKDSLWGPGNAVVIAEDSMVAAAARSGQLGEVYADIRDSAHLVVEFDQRARVVRHTALVDGFEVMLAPEVRPITTPGKSRPAP